MTINTRRMESFTLASSTHRDCRRFAACASPILQPLAPATQSSRLFSPPPLHHCHCTTTALAPSTSVIPCSSGRATCKPFAFAF
ncbi:uncharacterized protein BKA78DRAFT_135541 [Phyllosticta capitalensis]|uniref:uncharacterized protein n=1 Tax=Phyllosticta capitalensis TaxID=121624 RepID=UPI00313132F2